MKVSLHGIQCLTKEATLTGIIPEEFVANRLSCFQRSSKILKATNLMIERWKQL
jgi:hypothetical protein